MSEYGGFKPQILRKAIGISKAKLRYWKQELDPKPHRPAFTYQDIFVYRIIKALNEDRFISIKELSKFDLSELFVMINDTYFEDLEDLVLILDKETREVNLISEDELKLTPNNNLTYLFLKDLVDQHSFSFYYFGNHFPEEADLSSLFKRFTNN